MFGKVGTGSGTFTLHDKAGKPVLVVEAALDDGNHYYYYLEMTPIQITNATALHRHRTPASTTVLQHGHCSIFSPGGLV
jgi:hypothetical protein